MKENIVNLINNILENKNKEYTFQTRCERIYILLDNNNLLKEMANNLKKLLEEKNEYVYFNNNYEKILFLLREIKKELVK